MSQIGLTFVPPHAFGSVLIKRGFVIWEPLLGLFRDELKEAVAHVGGAVASMLL